MRVVKVTFLEDRARVLRVGRILRPAGRSELVLEGVSPVLVDKTVLARSSTPGVKVVDLRIDRTEVHHLTERGDPELEKTREQLVRHIADINSKVASATEEAASLDKVTSQAHAEISVDVAWGRSAPEHWTSILERVWARRVEVTEATDDLEVLLEKKREELRDLEGRLQEKQRPTDKIRARLTLDLDCLEGGEIDLEVGYVVPNACWRPAHRGELRDEGRHVRLVSEACLWQNTGEDWGDIQVELSTERPSLGASPPVLRPDKLHAQIRDRTIQVEARDEEIHDVGPRGGSGVTVTEVPGIDDGGEPMHLRAIAPVSLPSDGRPVRVPMFEVEMPAELSLVVMAERSLGAHRRTRQTYPGPHPLLPGPIDFVREGGLVGRGKIDFVAPQARFELGWGPDPDIQIVREHRQLDEKRRILTNWSRLPHRTEIHLSSLGSDPRTLEVIERIPVSELEKVRIEHFRAETSDEVEPDEDGFLRWTITLQPFERRTLKVAYDVEKHDDVRGI